MKQDQCPSPNQTFESLKGRTAREVRHAIRSQSYSGQTAGLAAGKLQSNLVILPEEFALDFFRFCQRNPKPCPITGISDTGNPMMFTMGDDIDIRSDVPQYNIYREGQLADSVLDISSLWQPDWVAFALGCSFTFEHAVMAAGVQLKHVEENLTVPMYRTNLQTAPAGRFSGEVVVSMRSIPQNQLDLVVAISHRFPLAHGSPVHIGDPQSIGINDLGKPDWGDAIAVDKGSIPVFWACGVTPQVAILRSEIPIAITHKPGRMLISDVDEHADNPNLTTH